MSFTISIYDLISWFITIVSVMLFLFERKKNNRIPYYMAVQGVLRACKTKAVFYNSQISQIKERTSNSSISRDEYLLFANMVRSDFDALMDHVMGSLKAIEPEMDIPFDALDFTSRKNKTDVKGTE